MDIEGLNLSLLGCSAPSNEHGMTYCLSGLKPFFL